MRRKNNENKTQIKTQRRAVVDTRDRFGIEILMMKYGTMCSYLRYKIFVPNTYIHNVNTP